MGAYWYDGRKSRDSVWLYKSNQCKAIEDEVREAMGGFRTCRCFARILRTLALSKRNGYPLKDFEQKVP